MPVRGRAGRSGIGRVLGVQVVGSGVEEERGEEGVRKGKGDGEGGVMWFWELSGLGRGGMDGRSFVCPFEYCVRLGFSPLLVSTFNPSVFSLRTRRLYHSIEVGRQPFEHGVYIDKPSFAV